MLFLLFKGFWLFSKAVEMPHLAYAVECSNGYGVKPCAMLKKALALSSLLSKL